MKRIEAMFKCIPYVSNILVLTTIFDRGTVEDVECTTPDDAAEYTHTVG
jgi:hypothetical protein